MYLFANPVKKQIIRLIKSNNGIFFGDLVRKINESRSTILHNLFDLKNKGLVTKDKDGGKFHLRKNAF